MRLKDYAETAALALAIPLLLTGMQILVAADSTVRGVSEDGLYHFVPTWQTVFAGLWYAVMAVPFLYVIYGYSRGWPMGIGVLVALTVPAVFSLLPILHVEEWAEETTGREKVI